uniref:Gustatory receptor n=1 Tax=Anopheles culicifacies TaxID=139723 RepID=A0A182MVW3_9DIPT
MAPKSVLTFTEKCCIWLLMVCGLLPFRLDASANRFVESTAHYWGNVAGTVLYAFVGPCIYWVSINMVLHPSAQMNYYLMVVQFLFMYIVVITSRIKAVANGAKLRNLLNALLALREQTLQGSSGVAFASTLSRKLFIKLMVFDLGMMVLSASFFRSFIDLQHSVFYTLLGFCNLLQVSSMNVSINFLLFVLYNAVNIYMIINARCNELVYGSKSANEIVRLYLMHTETSLIVQKIIQIVTLPILLLSTWYFFIIVFSVFYTYTSLVQDLHLGSLDALRNIINPIAFFISETAQVYFLASSSAMFTASARQIISQLSLYTGRISDGPEEQAIELVTIEHLNRDYTIQIKGLFTIDNTMLFSSSTMQSPRWLIVAESITLKFVFGILPLTFDRNSKRFQKRPKDVIVCVVWLVLFAVIGPIVCVVLFTMNFSVNDHITNVLSAFQFAFMYLFILIVQIMFLTKKETLHNLLNEMFELGRVLEKVLNRSITEFGVYRLIYFKIVIVDILTHLLSLYTFEGGTLGRANYVLTVSSLLFYGMMYYVTIVENFILIGLLICGVMQVMINMIVKQLPHRYQARSNHETTNVTVAPGLVQMYMLHCRNVDIVKKLMDTLNFPTLMITGWYFFMIIYSMYYMYVGAFVASQQGIKLDEVKAYMNPLIFFLYQCVQLYLIVLVPSVYTDQAKKMMRILNLIGAHQDQHHRLDQDRLIELLMVDCMQRNYSISNYGITRLSVPKPSAFDIGFHIWIIAMNTSKWSELLERFLWIFLLACGTFALQFNPGCPGRFTKSRDHVLYCIVMTLAFAIGTPAVMGSIYLYGYVGNFPTESIMVVLQLCCIYLFTLIVNVKMLINVDRVCYTLNVLLALRNSVLRKGIWCRGPHREYTKLLFFKIVFVDVALLVFSFIMFYVSLDEAPAKAQIAVGVCFLVLRYIITAFVNLYLVGLMNAILIQESINAELTKFVDQPDAPMESTLHHAYRMHCKNAQLEKQFMAIMNLPVLLLNCWYFLMIVVSIYYMYSSTMVEIKQQDLGVEDIVKYVNSVSFFLYLCLQLYCIVTIPALYTERSKQMCTILNAISQRCESQGMERLLELIMLDCMHRNYSVTNYGLYEMDRALLFGLRSCPVVFLVVALKVKAIIIMKLFLLTACFLLASIYAAQALRCMQGIEVVTPSDGASDADKDKMPKFTECTILNTATSAASLLLTKPNTITVPSTDYKCYHLRYEESESKEELIMQGCIYKAQNVCDGKFENETVREVSCSQCDEDECNSALRFASNWKILSLTLFTIVCFLMK